jgi:hypothetical protein
MSEAKVHWGNPPQGDKPLRIMCDWTPQPPDTLTTSDEYKVTCPECRIHVNRYLRVWSS